MFRNFKYIPLLDEIAYYIFLRAIRYQEKRNRSVANRIHETVRMGRLCTVDKNISIGKGTYCGEYCHFYAGENSTVSIGRYCAIGSNVKIKARTHDQTKYTPDENGPNKVKEKSIKIGNHVWIGDNVFIKEGVIISDYAIIGSNSVVTSNLGVAEVWGGVPARKIKTVTTKNE